MKTSRTILFVATVLAVCAAGLNARGHRFKQTGEPGVFDFYVLTLSWSPEFCQQHSENPECQSGHHGFIVHGLWPQFTDGYPENCSESRGPTNPSEMLDIMPDARLIQHEWRTHGTCSGLSAEEYFRLIRKAFTSINIPANLANPSEGFSIAPDALKQEFKEANPKLKRESIGLSCGNNYLTAVHVCLTKTLESTSCVGLRECRAKVIKVTSVR